MISKLVSNNLKNNFKKKKKELETYDIKHAEVRSCNEELISTPGTKLN